MLEKVKMAFTSEERFLREWSNRQRTPIETDTFPGLYIRPQFGDCRGQLLEMNSQSVMDANGFGQREQALSGKCYGLKIHSDVKPVWSTL